MLYKMTNNNINWTHTFDTHCISAFLPFKDRIPFAMRLHVVYNYLLYKVQCFIRISGSDKTDNLTCEIIYDDFTCKNCRFSNNHQS